MTTSTITPSPVSTTDDWLTFNQELSRKTADQLQVWTDRYDRGVVTLATMISVVSALYDTTSGLIDRDLSNLLADVHRDLMREAQNPR